MTIAQDIDFGLSPPASSPDLTMSHSFDDFEDGDVLAGDVGAKPKKTNGRKGVGGAEKRATHNAVERARRGSLNDRFLILADALPSMANVKRPSKSLIVNKALEFVGEAQDKEFAFTKENNDLRLMVDQLRFRLGMAALPPPDILPSAVNITRSTVTPSLEQHYSRSFSSTDGTSFGSGSFDDRAPFVGSPSSDLQSHSPSSAYSAHHMALPSPAHTDINSPTLAYPSSGVFFNPVSTSSDPAPRHDAPQQASPVVDPSSYLAHVAGPNLHANLEMAQSFAAQGGFMSPSAMVHHSLVYTPAVYQPQQPRLNQHLFHQITRDHFTSQQDGLADMYGIDIGPVGSPWSVFGAGGGSTVEYPYTTV